MDTPESGSGDHENYLKDSKDAYDIKDNGKIKEFCNCEKKAVVIRQKVTHRPWYSLAEFNLVFSKPIPRYQYMSTDYEKSLNPSYG